MTVVLNAVSSVGQGDTAALHHLLGEISFEQRLNRDNLLSAEDKVQTGQVKPQSPEVRPAQAPPLHVGNVLPGGLLQYIPQSV